MKPPVEKITPNLVVDSIEPSLAFWAKLGYSLGAHAKCDDRLGFAILSDGETELMYQARQSLTKEAPGLSRPGGGTLLYVEVNDIDSVEAALAEEQVVVSRRLSFYGCKEIGYREPGGHYVLFAEREV